MINEDVIRLVAEHLGERIANITPVAGGSINRAFKLQGSRAAYFIKVNSKSRFPGMFEAEALGLELIRKTGAINAPKVLYQDNAGDESFLLLEWIETRRHTPKASETLGRSLALMHKNTALLFGLEHDNYMGSLAQSNKQHHSWTGFFIEERLQPMVRMAVDKQLLNANDAGDFERLYKNLPTLFDEEPPALIHGDLWSGNYLVDVNETPYLVDPAVSYGHREFDIAMTTLFGGFSDAFYRAYQEAFPLTDGWEDRLDLWNLYPLLVHLNLFGAGYLGEVRGCLRRYM